MKKNEIIEFFDKYAPTWDESNICDTVITDKIFEAAGIAEGKTVLDVASGTGILFPEYLKRNVKSVTAVDISPKMAEKAESKKNSDKITVICGDIHEFFPSEKFDCIMVFNAFPHFFNPEGLIEHLAALSAEKGRLTVAHSLSREKIDECHSGGAKDVSLGLPEAQELAELMNKYFIVDTAVSDSEKYIVSGILR